MPFSVISEQPASPEAPGIPAENDKLSPDLAPKVFSVAAALQQAIRTIMACTGAQKHELNSPIPYVSDGLIQLNLHLIVTAQQTPIQDEKEDEVTQFCIELRCWGDQHKFIEHRAGLLAAVRAKYGVDCPAGVTAHGILWFVISEDTMAAEATLALP